MMIDLCPFYYDDRSVMMIDLMMIDQRNKRKKGDTMLFFIASWFFDLIMLKDINFYLSLVKEC